MGRVVMCFLCGECGADSVLIFHMLSSLRFFKSEVRQKLGMKLNQVVRP